MEPDISNYIKNVKSSQSQPNQVQQARIIGPNQMSRQQVYDHIEKNPPSSKATSRAIPPEMLRMAAELRQGDMQNRQIANQAKSRRQASSLKLDVPSR